MKPKSFLLIHGLGGSGPDHWQSWLAQELLERNYHVCYPTFSHSDSPNKEVWLEELSSAIATIPENHSLTVITHSLGCLLWLHYAALQNKKAANQVILVAPPSPTNTLSVASSFFPVPLRGNHLCQAAEKTLIVQSTNDPYCPIEEGVCYLRLGAPAIYFPNFGHINTHSGHGKWPWILDLCVNKEVRMKEEVFKQYWLP